MGRSFCRPNTPPPQRFRWLFRADATARLSGRNARAARLLNIQQMAGRNKIFASTLIQVSEDDGRCRNLDAANLIRATAPFTAPSPLPATPTKAPTISTHRTRVE